MGHSNLQKSPYFIEDSISKDLDRNLAIETIMNTYGEEIKRLVYSYVKNSADTDDITQEIFVLVYQKLHTFKGNSTFRSWIYSIAINKCKDHLRKWKFRNERFKEYFNKEKRESDFNTLPTENLIMINNEHKKLYNTIMNLPVRYREVIILYYFEDLTTKEIALALKNNEGTVRTRLARARDLLKRKINHK